MNKKIIIGITLAIIVIAVGIAGIKAMWGDESVELPYEEKIEKTLNTQNTEPNESVEEEMQEYNP